MGELTLDRLSPYERGIAEGVLFRIAYAEQDYCEAREHLLSAIESGGLTEPRTDAQEALERLDASTRDGSSCIAG